MSKLKHEFKPKSNDCIHCGMLEVKGEKSECPAIVTPDRIWDIFSKKRNKVDILIEALDHMQSYNGRSKSTCIGLALGFEYEDMGL